MLCLKAGHILQNQNFGDFIKANGAETASDPPLGGISADHVNAWSLMSLTSHV
jgi:hypothetical protein